MPGLQDLIHRLEEGEGARFVKLTVVFLALLGLTVLYNLREFSNFSTPQAMDAAQLARNISEGKGFTTDYIRPLSLYLVQKHRTDGSMLLKEGHPDLANPPVYPLALAGLMKILPFRFTIAPAQELSRYQPEFIIGLFNQLLFFIALWMVFRLARELFDQSVAWLSVVVLAGTDLFWRVSVSGLSTMLLAVVFLGIAYCLVRLEQGLSKENRSNGWFIGWAVAAGLLVGLAGLTRYAFAWLIIPVIAFLLLFFGQRRITLALAAAIAFAAVFTPWLIRNYDASGTLFGTASYAVYQDMRHQDTLPFPGTMLERSIQPSAERLNAFTFEDYLRKLVVNGSEVVQTDLPKMGGNWFSAFFLVGLLVMFRNRTLTRLRVFLLICIGIIAAVQALIKTHSNAAVPEAGPENLLVVFVPLVIVFGVAMYFLLLDQLELPLPELRRWITVGVALLVCAPLLFRLLPPRSQPIAYPPYFPPVIQKTAGFMEDNDLLMSDIPWAVAWYGHRQCLWLTAQLEPDFFAINDFQKPILALYLTQMTLDEHFQSKLVKGEYRPWGRFILESLLTGKVPTGFPLRTALSDVLPDQMFLTDWERWNSPAK